MRVALIGAGAVGASAARQLATSGHEISIFDQKRSRSKHLAGVIGSQARALGSYQEAIKGTGAVLLASPGSFEAASEAVGLGLAVVSTSDSLGSVRRLLSLDALARDRGVSVIAGAGFAPGFSCALVGVAASRLDRVEEIRVARVGAGGPACRSTAARARVGRSLDWKKGEWIRQQGGSGRELFWFPDPIQGRDCYRARLSDALLLQPRFPSARLIASRLASGRVDVVKAKVHSTKARGKASALGALRVEVRGWSGEAYHTEVLGALDQPSRAAGVVSALCVDWLAEGLALRTGAGGIASAFEPRAMVRSLAQLGVRAAEFVGN